jgi:hypothetical protein
MKTILFFLTIFSLSSCANNIYFSEDAYELSEQHQTFAIIPPKVAITPGKNIDSSTISTQQKTESLNFQKEMFSWFLKRKTQGKFAPELQDVETTNALLAKAGYPDTPMTSAELCEVLHVDGYIISNFQLSKPVSENTAIALALIAGVSASTNQVSVNLSINDCSRTKMIWNTSFIHQGGIGSSPAILVNDIMRYCSKKMPYADQK